MSLLFASLYKPSLHRQRLTDASLQMYSHLRGSTCKETPVSLDLQGELKVVGKSVSAVE